MRLHQVRSLPVWLYKSRWTDTGYHVPAVQMSHCRLRYFRFSYTQRRHHSAHRVFINPQTNPITLTGLFVISYSFTPVENHSGQRYKRCLQRFEYAYWINWGLAFRSKNLKNMAKVKSSSTGYCYTHKYSKMQEEWKSCLHHHQRHTDSAKTHKTHQT